MHFVVKWSRRIFFALKQIHQNISSDNAIENLGDAYAEENESKLRQADLQYAYSKLVELSVTKNRSYRQRLADLREVRERQLPANEYLMKLLSDALRNQSDPDMKFEVFSYFIHVKEVVAWHILSWSIWLVAISVGIYFFVTKTLDALEIYQLAVIILLTMAFTLFPATFAKCSLKRKVFLSIFILLCLFGYLALFSFLNHILTAPTAVEKMGMQIEYPLWITRSSLFDSQSSDACGSIITIKAMDGSSLPATIPTMKIDPDANTTLFDATCVPLFQGDLINSGVAPKTAFVYKVSRKIGNESFFQVPSLKLTIQFTDPAVNVTERADLEIKQEHILWYYSRLAFLGLFTAIVLTGGGNAVVDAVKDSVSKKLNPDDKKA